MKKWRLFSSFELHWNSKENLITNIGFISTGNRLGDKYYRNYGHGPLPINLEYRVQYSYIYVPDIEGVIFIRRKSMDKLDFDVLNKILTSFTPFIGS